MFCRKKQPIKQLASEALTETHSRLEQLEKDVQFLRDAVQNSQSIQSSQEDLIKGLLNAVQKTQSEYNFLFQYQNTFDNYLKLFDARIFELETILEKKQAITAAKPKQRKRTKQTAKRGKRDKR